MSLKEMTRLNAALGALGADAEHYVGLARRVVAAIRDGVADAVK